MRNFTFYSPTFFAFGKDTENDAGKYVRKFGGTKVLIHYGGGGFPLPPAQVSAGHRRLSASACAGSGPGSAGFPLFFTHLFPIYYFYFIIPEFGF